MHTNIIIANLTAQSQIVDAGKRQRRFVDLDIDAVGAWLARVERALEQIAALPAHLAAQVTVEGRIGEALPNAYKGGEATYVCVTSRGPAVVRSAADHKAGGGTTDFVRLRVAAGAREARVALGINGSQYKHL